MTHNEIKQNIDQNSPRMPENGPDKVENRFFWTPNRVDGMVPTKPNKNPAVGTALASKKAKEMKKKKQTKT